MSDTAKEPGKTGQTRPIVRTGITTDFGELLDDPETLLDGEGMSGDLTYIPGFSDLRREQDLAKARGEKPRALPVNIRCVQRTRVNGEPTIAKTVSHQNRGYRPVQASDVGKHPWLTDMPPAAKVLPDGTLGIGDTVLMVTDARQAAKNQAALQVKWRQRNEDGASALKLLQAGAAVKGADPKATVGATGPKDR